MDPLKEMFNTTYYNALSDELKKAYSKFDGTSFLKEVTKNLPELSLNQRLRNTSVVLNKYMPDDYSRTIEIMKKVIVGLKPGYTALVFPDYVSLYGVVDFNLSMDALAFFTRFGSSEFAIRVFLKNDFERTIKVMEKWATDKNHHVRRLASEGSRPRLPWSFKLEQVIKNPQSTQHILNLLKADKELYVKKSVANHLNDISKDNSEYMLRVIKAWDKKNADTAWIVKHASRTLIKKGDASSLAVFDFEKNIQVEIKKFILSPSKLKLGNKLHFEFALASKKNKQQKLVVDYKIYYRKKSGELLPKVFKLKELSLGPLEQIKISKSQQFKNFTTRKHFSGKHRVEIMVNGKALAKKEFTLTV